MIIKETLNVSDTEFFDYITDALYKELKRIVSRNLKRSEVKEGFKFVKRYNQGKTRVEIDCVIEKMDIPHEYRLLMKMPKTEQVIAHRVTRIDDSHIELEYEEDVITSSLYVKFNKSFKAAKARKNMQRNVKRLEEEIIARRK